MESAPTDGLLVAMHRSDTHAMADAIANQRIAIKTEQIRGIPLSNLLQGGAHLFADGGAAARQDPAGTCASAALDLLTCNDHVSELCCCCF